MTNEELIKYLKLMKKEDGTNVYNDNQLKSIINNPLVLESYKDALVAYQNTMITLENDFNLENNIKVLKFK